MLKLAIDALTPTMTGLGLFERYAGLVRVATMKEEIGTTQSGEPIFRDLVFPVACGVTNRDCWESGKYADLTPNSSKKSVAYWEFLSGMRLTQNSGDVYTFTGAARFVAWLNIPKLNLNGTGGTDCSISPLIELRLIKELQGKRFSVSSPALSQSGVAWFTKTSQPEGDARIFNRYTYDRKGININAFTLYPYEVMAIDFQVNLQIAAGCILDISPDTPIDCVTL